MFCFPMTSSDLLVPESSSFTSNLIPLSTSDGGILVPESTSLVPESTTSSIGNESAANKFHC